MKRILALLSLLALGACGLEGSQVNQIGLTYSGGIIEDKEFKGLLEPGATNTATGFGSTTYFYPNDQRTYKFSREGGGDVAAAIVSPTSEGTRVVLEGIITFRVCQPTETDQEGFTNDWGTEGGYAACLRSFHENIGLKTAAYSGNAGWDAMLTEFLRPAIEISVNRSTRSYTVDQVLTTETLDALNDEIRRTLPAEVTANMDGNFFYFSSVSFEQIEPESPSVQAAYDERAAARLEVAAERERGELRDVQGENLELLRGIFEDEGQLNCYLQTELGRELGVMPPPCFAEEEPEIVSTTP
jgi:hypothetical protein